MLKEEFKNNFEKLKELVRNDSNIDCLIKLVVIVLISVVLKCVNVKMCFVVV